MGRRHVSNAHAKALSPGGPIAVSFSNRQLLLHGCNLSVEIATAAAFVGDPVNPTPRNSIVAMAHLDTGASRTVVSSAIAQHLALATIGVGSMNTANGLVTNPTYAVDVTFVGTTLTPRANLDVASCALPFTMQRHAEQPQDPTNIGILIGRDVMAFWHIAWDGPTSTVMIYD